MAELPPPPEGMVLTHFIVSDDVERSRRFYTEVLGGRVERPGDPVNVALANGWIVINAGGARPTTSLRSSWRRLVIPTGSAASLTSGSKTSMPSMGVERPGCSVPDAAEAASVREALLHPRSRRSPHRTGTDHGPRGRLGARSLAIEYVRRGVLMNAALMAADMIWNIRATT